MTAKTAARKRKPGVAGGHEPLSTVAGDGVAGFGGDGRPAPEAQLAFPAGVAVGQGAVFIADHANHQVRRIDGSGVLTTVAGDGLRGFAGDAGDAVSARLGFPAAVAVDAEGNVFVADEMNHRIRRIDPSGVIDTVAGDGSRGGHGDGGPAVHAQLDAPCALAVNGAGSLYVGEAGGLRVRRIDSDGNISTVVAASGRSTTSGAADAGESFLPAGLAVDTSGKLYIADPVGRRVLLLGAEGTLKVLAGPPKAGAGVTEADWTAPVAVAVDAQEVVYVADVNGHRVWRLSDGAAQVVAGPEPSSGAPTGSDGAASDGAAGDALGGSLLYPCALAVDPAGRLLVADNFHHRIAALPLPAAPSRTTGPAPEKPAQEKKPARKKKPAVEKKPKPDKPKPDGETAGSEELDRPVTETSTARLLVRQEVGVEVPRGGSDLLHVRVSSDDAWTPGRVEHRFTAPTGFFFDGRATCAYYRVDGSVATAPEPTATLGEGGRLLSVTDEPRLNTSDDPAAALVYTLGIRAGTDAEPGRYTDGRAVIAGQPEVRLKASVLDDEE